MSVNNLNYFKFCMPMPLLFILLTVLIGCSGDNGDISCDEYPLQSESMHVLPYAVGESYLVSRAACAVSHPPPKLQYAYDFPMPVGTAIHASRGGKVAWLRNQIPSGGGSGFGNFIYITHDDDTISRYAHLTENGVQVVLGEVVQQGQLIGLSGDTGESTGPHLHFDVASCTENSDQCVTIATTFSNTRPHPDGLVIGESYLAEIY